MEKNKTIVRTCDQVVSQYSHIEKNMSYIKIQIMVNENSAIK